MWRNRHKDPLNSDYFPGKGPDKFRVKKRLLKDIPAATFVAVDENKHLYVYTLNESGEDSANLWAFDRDGNELWNTSEVKPSLSSIGISESGEVYVADGHFLTKIDNKGKIVWQSALEEETSAIMFLSEETLLILGIKGNLYAYDISGKLLCTPYYIGCQTLEKGVSHSHMPTNQKRLQIFKKGVESINVSSKYSAQAVKRFLGIGVSAKNVPAIDQKSQSIYIVANAETGKGSDFICVVWDKENKTFIEKYRTNIGPGCDTSPNISFNDKHVYCVDKEGVLYAISREKGNVSWTYQMSNTSSASVNSTPDNLIYVSIKDEIVCIEDKSDKGELKWISQMTKEAQRLRYRQCMINSVLCVAENNIYAIAAYGKQRFKQFFPFKHQLIVINRLTGELLSTLPIGHESACTPSMLDENTLIVPSKPFFQGVMAVLRKSNPLFRLILPKPVTFYGVVLYESV